MCIKGKLYEGLKMEQLEFEQDFERLPLRPKQVLLHMLGGETDAEIAAALGIEESTVRKYIEKICRTFGLLNEGAGDRRSRRSEIVTLFAQYKPTLLGERASNLTDSGSASRSIGAAEQDERAVVSTNQDVASPAVWATLLESSDQEQKNQTAKALNELGYKLYMNGDFRSATFYLDWTLKFNPALTSARYNLGSAYEKLDNKVLARTHYEKAAEGNGRAAHAAVNNLARLQILQGETEAAIDLLLSCLKQVQEPIVKWALHKNLGWAYLLQEHYSDAERHLQAAIKLDSQRPDAYCLLAQVQEAQGNEQGLIELWKNCLECSFDDKNAAKAAWRFPELELWQAEAHSRLKAAS